MGKVEMTLEEYNALISEIRKENEKRVLSGLAERRSSKPKKTTKRTKSAWQRYMANKKKQIKFKSGKRKGRLDLKRMGAAFRREQKKSKR